MSVFEAIVLGLVQGVTEFLPVSSSAHLIIFRRLLHVQDDQVLFSNVLFHGGSLLAILLTYSADIRKLVLAYLGILMDAVHNIKIRIVRLSGGDGEYRKLLGTNYRRMGAMLFFTTIPTAVIGMLLAGLVDSFSDNLLVPGVGLYITAIMLIVSQMMPEGNRIPKNMRTGDALIAGIFQGFSVCPGISRLGTTLSACVLGGMNRKAAVKYSILASVPAIIGSIFVEIDRLKDVQHSFSFVYLIGMAVSAVIGYYCIRILLRVVRNRQLKYFSVYCLIVGTLAIAGSFWL